MNKINPKSIDFTTDTTFVPRSVTGLVKVSFEDIGDRIAMGGNSAPKTFVRGFQVAGGEPDEGDDGTILHAVGHASWPAMTPSKNYSAIEWAIYPTMAGGWGDRTIGGNTLTVTSGSTPDVKWVGNRIYIDRVAYKISSVSSNVITVTTLAGSVVSWSSSTTGKQWKVCYIYGTGQCTVSGNSVTRISGDPFSIYYTNPSFIFKLNGVVKTVTAMPDVNHCTISSPPTNGTYTFEFFLTVNDQITTFRLHSMHSDLENFAIHTNAYGYWIQSQASTAGGGRYNPIIITSGVRSDTFADYRQIVIHEDSNMSLGGDYGYEALRIIGHEGIAPVNRVELTGAPTGFGPVFKFRGADTDVSGNFDTQGVGGYTFTQANFARILFKLNSSSSAVNYPELDATNTGVAPTLTAKGSDTNIDFSITGKGTGGVLLGNQQANYIKASGATTTFSPALRAFGSDTNVSFGIDTKGTGGITFTQDFTRTIAVFNAAASAANYLELDAVAAGNAVAIQAKGSDTNIDMALITKGAGVPKFGVFTSGSDAAVNGYITIKDAAGNTRKLATIA